jgi:hypothetical protein
MKDNLLWQIDGLTDIVERIVITVSSFSDEEYNEEKGEGSMSDIKHLQDSEQR